MSCVLRLTVPDAAAPAARAALRPYRVAAAGDGRTTLHCDVSAADADAFARQVDDAVRYLRAHDETLAALHAAGAAGELDFALGIDGARVQVTARFPASLASAAGRLGLALVASVYVVDEGPAG